MRFIILAGSLTGNRGSEAMVSTCIQKIKERFESPVIWVATYYPEEDLDWVLSHKDDFSSVSIASCTPVQLVINWLPLSLLARVFPGLKRKKSKQTGTILDLLNADVVLDVAGVSFIDGREKFLPYNILTLFPFLLNKIPVYKMSQAVGPFTSFLNRTASSLFLTRVSGLYARGSRTYELVATSGLPVPCTEAPDITFCLQSASPTPYSLRKEKSIALLPSSLVMSKHEEYIPHMILLVKELQKEGYSVTLITHSWRDSDQSRNNDIIAAKRITEGLTQSVPIVGPGLNALGLRREIEKHRVAITSRFHGMVGALETETPVIVIGWSHKYLEVLEQFGFSEEVCFDYKTLHAGQVKSACVSLLENGNSVSEQIKKRLPEVRESSQKQFTHIFGTLTA